MSSWIRHIRGICDCVLIGLGAGVAALFLAVIGFGIIKLIVEVVVHAR